jgi:hypothetical protein
MRAWPARSGLGCQSGVRAASPDLAEESVGFMNDDQVGFTGSRAE